MNTQVLPVLAEQEQSEDVVEVGVGQQNIADGSIAGVLASRIQLGKSVDLSA